MKSSLKDAMSNGLVVTGEDSCSGGRGLKYQHWILDGHFSHYKLYWLFEKTGNEQKEAEDCVLKHIKNISNVNICYSYLGRASAKKNMMHLW